MEKLHIRATEDTPEIVFDSNTNTIAFSGKSYPDNVISFYEPVLNWLTKYAGNPKLLTSLIVKLDYFNTASAKILFDILSIFDAIQAKGHQVYIAWHYKLDDEDMKEAGEGYQKIIETEIELISY